jgi:hypothetical protein
VRLRLSTAAMGLLYYPPGEIDVDLGRRDRLGLAPNLSTRAIWQSPETSLERVEGGRRK